jgi:hypothetical protein
MKTKTRFLSTILWFFAGWYVANILAAVFGASELLGPIVGTAAAILIGGDPLHVLWTPRSEGSRVAPATTFGSASKTH